MDIHALSEDLYYDINPSLVRAFASVFSYSYDAKTPLSWAHYAHHQALSPFSSARNENNWCSLFIFLSGNFGFLIDGHMYTPKFGDAVIIRDCESYTSIFPEASDVDYYQFYIPTEFFEKVKNTNLFYGPFYDRRLSRKNLVSPDKTSCAEIIKHLHILDELYANPTTTSDILMYSHIIQIMERIHSCFYAQSLSVSNAKIPKKLNDAILYIHTNFTTLESICEVSAACNISNAYLSKIFKNYLQCTPNDYVTNLRISHAKYLLSIGESIIDTCFKSGFNNYTYFITKFKSVTGTTPSRYTKSI